MNKIKVSIITVCFNAEKTISQTIQSVLEQDYADIEYLIVDGASTDNTNQIIHSFSNSKISAFSEKDNGLYDAINKGINRSTGDVIGLLHADDVYANASVISTIVKEFEQEKDLDALSTSVEIFKTNKFKTPYRVYSADQFKTWQFRIGIQPPHPGFFVRKEAFHAVGFYRTQYKISGDFDWLLRAIKIHRLKVKYSHFVSVFMLDGGLSSSGWNSKVKMNNENLKILKSHGFYSNKFLMYLKYAFKVFQLRQFN